MLYKNNEGHIDLRYHKELSSLIGKMIAKHKPQNPIEFQALCNSIQTKVGYDVALTELSYRSEKLSHRSENKS